MACNAPVGRLSALLVVWVLTIPGASLFTISLFSRPEFLQTALATSFPLLDASDKPDSLSLPLLFLRKSGCLAVLVELKQYAYIAIIDTGSPFWTSSADIQSFSRQSGFVTTLEQYGPEVGEMKWRTLPTVTLCDVQGRSHKYRNVVMGVPSPNVIDKTGGIYFGLIQRDRYRPTVMEQLGYTSFCLSYLDSKLTLSRTSLIPVEQQPTSMKLFDFSPYSSNIHQYGTLCDEFELQLDSRRRLRVQCSSLKHPVVVVLDSGLTGCILSDTLHDELVERDVNFALQNVQGALLNLEHVVLSSDPKYWVVSSFRLPWFDLDETTQPHVIAAGASFLCKARITVDTQSQRVFVDV